MIYIYVNFKAINNVLDTKMYIMYIWSHPCWLLFTVIYESTQFSIQIDQLKVQCICLLTQDTYCIHMHICHDARFDIKFFATCPM